MAAKPNRTAQTTAHARFEPELSIPDDLESVAPQKLTKKVRSMFVGLGSITMTATFTSPERTAEEDKVQKLEVEDPTVATVPDMPVETICSGLYYRAHNYLSQLMLSERIQLGGKCKFTCVIYRRTDDNEKGWETRQVSFDLMALREELLDGEDEEEDEEGEDESGEEEDGEEGEDEEDESDGEDEEEEGEDETPDEDNEEDTTAEAHRRRVQRLRAGLGMPRTGPGVRVTTAGLPLDPPPFESPERSPIDAPEQVGDLPSAPRARTWSRHMGGPEDEPRVPSFMRRSAMARTGQMSPQTEGDIVGVMREMTTLMIERERMVMARDAHFFAEVRASIGAIRSEFQFFMQESREELRSARSQLDRSNDRLFQLSNLSGNYLENQAKANEQGWQAFQAGMQMMIQAAQQTGSEQHQIHAIQMQQMAYQHQVELERERERNARALPAQGATSTANSERGGFVREVVAPLAVAITSEALRSRGNVQAADLLTSAAAEYMGDEDDDDDDDDDDETTEASAAKSIFDIPSAPKAKSQPDPNSKNPPSHLVKLPKGYTIERLFDEQPIVAMLRCLRAWLTRDQRKDVVEIIGQPAWSALETASKQPKDTKAILKLIAVRSTLQKDGIRDQIAAVLSPSQAELLDDLLTQLEGKVGLGQKDGVVDTTASPTSDS